MDTLVIIDMQDIWISEIAQKAQQKIDSVIEHIKELIVEYRESNKNIILVEFGDDAPTISSIMEILSDYPYLYKVTKNRMDGGKEIIDKANQLGISHNFVVCGVYADWCVLETTIGLCRESSSCSIKLDRSGIYPDFLVLGKILSRYENQIQFINKQKERCQVAQQH